MNIVRDHSVRVRLLLIFLIFTIIHIINGLTPVFEIWNSRFFDVLFTERSNMTLFAPVYDDTVVHVDLDDSSLQQLQNYYLNRSHHARLITNLSNMGVSAQLHDVIFAAPANQEDDDALIEAVKNSINVYFGLAFRLSSNEEGIGEKSPTPEVDSYLADSSWNIGTKGDPVDFYRGYQPLITYPELARASSGLGFLNLTANHDGVFRKIPLLVRYGDVYYPSAPFRLICDYLGVGQSDIVIEPGNSITLSNLGRTGGNKAERIEIPIDSQGNMVINFIGSWARMKHYHFADVLLASEDQDMWHRWVEELSDKIVVVSEITTGSSDVGSVPTDSSYPLSGVNANVIHTILTNSFIKEASPVIVLIAEMILLFSVFFLSFRSSTLVFSLNSLGIIFLYLIISAFLFLMFGFIINVIIPAIMACLTFLAVQIVRALENAKSLKQSELERNIFEREMEIGRKIQSGFFPENLPDIDGWEIAAFFRPARQVSGDFYDTFPIDNNKLAGFVIADVCDKGVGAALFMTLVRSLLRAFAQQNLDNGEYETDSIGSKLRKTIRLTNNYIADTHGRANMFATLFIGILDPGNGKLNYINCGHEPPIVQNESGQLLFLKPTSPAIGMFPDIISKSMEIQLQPGDIFLSFTDGVTDATDKDGNQFSKENVLDCLENGPKSAKKIVDLIMQRIDNHALEAEQFDDITLMTIKRIE